ncbi:MAG TPA: AsmA-like C-terminal region-containing protein [Vicinamibacterales bacterium]|nr:AsmA-like C-terminal region-containing protein [Vicinamibacterales bacterium]
MSAITSRLSNPQTRRRLVIATALLLASAAILLSLATRLTPFARDRVLEALGSRFDARIELRTFQLSVFPRPTISGEGLVIRHRGRTDVPPLIAIESFSAAAGLAGLLQRPLRLHSVTLHGLELHIPAGDDDESEAGGSGSSKDAADRSKDDAASRSRAGEGGPIEEAAPSSLTIGRIASTDARLEIASSKPGKPPRVFAIHDLVVDDFGPDGPASFAASLTNPKPSGRIETRGTFGPWNQREPRRTAIEGTYSFTNANLDTIKGIGGILASEGRFSGVLERLDVEGDTDTPDFSIDIGGRPVHLKTRFQAVVDGTSGDTWLTPVDATLGSTLIRAEGAIVRAEDVKGRLIALDVTISKGRIEDVLTLALRSGKPPLVGALALETRLEIPPGDRDVLEKLRLEGNFALREARFANFDIQKRIDTLSRRGRGEAGEADGESVVSNMKGRFKLDNGQLTFQQLTFGVPGASVRLAGTYSLTAETLDFRGDLLLDASLSETTEGWKAVLAKLAQPLFSRKGGGSRIPIKVEGTRDKPQFGLDIGRALTPG